MSFDAADALRVNGDDVKVNKNESSRFSDPTQPKKTKCFIAVMLTNENVKEGIEIMQRIMAEEDENCTPFLFPKSKLHITVAQGFKIALEDELELEYAKESIRNAVLQHNVDFERDKCVEANGARIEGVATFTGTSMENKVIFSDIGGESGEYMNAKLTSIRRCIQERLNYLNAVSEPFPYKPHITIAFVDDPKSDYVIPKRIWEDFEDTIFGTQVLGSIQLLTRQKNVNEDGYKLIYEVSLL